MINYRIYATDVDEYTNAQIENILGMKIFDGTTIRFMPDCHAGKVIPIGTIIRYDHMPDIVMPIVTGADIGCSISVHEVTMKGKNGFEPEKLDTIIREMKAGIKSYYDESDFDFLPMVHADINEKRVRKCVGSIGDGNHFIEVDKDEEDRYYITIHSGSRSLGGYMYEYWLNKAQEESGHEVRILSWLTEKESIENWISDVRIAEKFTTIHHNKIVDYICDNMKWKRGDFNTGVCHHNTVHRTPKEFIITKGAIYVHDCDTTPKPIPLNMRDGVLVVNVNPDGEWMDMLPHGAGRVRSRKDTRSMHSVRQLKDSMIGIYSTCLNRDTLDEGHFAYKDQDYTISALSNYTTIVKHIKPIYVFKESGGRGRR